MEQEVAVRWREAGQAAHLQLLREETNPPFSFLQGLKSEILPNIIPPHSHHIISEIWPLLLFPAAQNDHLQFIIVVFLQEKEEKKPHATPLTTPIPAASPQ